MVERAPLARDRARQLPRRPARPLRARLRPALAAREAGREGGRARPGRAQSRSARSSSAPSSSSTPPTRRCGSSPSTRSRTRRRSRSSRARASATAAARHRAGLCWHRYEIDDDGMILDAKIVPPTSQNQKTIESDLHGVVERYVDLPDDRAVAALRAGDPQLRPVHLLRDALPRRWRSTADERSSASATSGAATTASGPRSPGGWAGTVLCGEPIGLVEALERRSTRSCSSTPSPRVRPPGTVHAFDASIGAAADGAVRRLVHAHARPRRGRRARPLARPAPRDGCSSTGSRARASRSARGSAPRSRRPPTGVVRGGSACMRSI